MAIEINGRYYTWHDLEFSITLDGAAREILIDITSLSWDHSIEKVNVYGASRAPLGQATGSYQPQETTAELYKAAWEEVKSQIGDGYLQADCALSVRYATDNQAVQQTDIEGTFLGEAESLAVSADPLIVPVRIMPTLIRTNGLTAYRNSF